MYRKKDRSPQSQIHMLCIEELVPKNHLLREIDKAISFDFIYEDVKGLYKEAEWGNPGIDPVSLFKIVFIQYIYGIRSMRQTIKEIEVNNAYRWFIGYDLMEPIPHFSTFSKNYTRRFKDTEVFQNIFTHILEEAVRCGFIDASAVYIDGTHIRANANKNKNAKEIAVKEAKQYQAELDEEIQKDRAAHGKKPLKEKDSDNGGTESEESENCGGSDISEAKISDKETKIATITKSTTDPECGLFHKGEHEKQFAYVTNTACDNNNFVLAFTVGAGNIHDSIMFDKVFEKAKALFPEIDTVAADLAYRIPWIAKLIIESGMKPAMPYKRPMTAKGYFKKHDYVYDEYYDCYLCPNNQVLKYSTTNREGYREYKSVPNDCRNCPYRSQCTNSKNCQKVVTRHIWEDYLEIVEDFRHTPEIKAIYDKRKETIERVFADAKVKHGLRYTQLRGLAKVTMQVTLTFACMNLKKLAKLKGKSSSPSLTWNNMVAFTSLFQKFKPRSLAFA